MSNAELSDWIVGYSQEHEHQFWYNLKTGASSWINPALIIVSKKRKHDPENEHNSSLAYKCGGHFIALEDHPSLSIERDRVLDLVLEALVKGNEVYGPLTGDSKTARACREHGMKIGLLGILARIVWFELLAQIFKLGDVGSVNMDSIFPSVLEGDPAVKKELVEMGRTPDNVSAIMAGVALSLTSGAKKLLDMRRDVLHSNVATTITLSITFDKNKKALRVLEYAGQTLSISPIHFDKLLNLYRLNTDRHSHEQDPLFLRRLFCVLARYETLSGKSDGYQMAFPDVGFQFLRDEFGVDTECFASPLNCWNQHFCSVARDTDQFFGSLGNFFCFEGQNPRQRDGLHRGGSFEANPPFVEAVMDQMADRIFYLLKRYPHAPFSFVVIVPAWADCTGVIAMTNSEFTKPYSGYRLVLEKKKHDYRPGMQHRTSHTHQPSNVDTFVFFLQNEAGARKWPVSLGQAERLKTMLEEDCKAKK